MWDDSLFYNADHGFLEGVLRGLKDGILTGAQYATLTQCETIDDFKLQLGSTDYAGVLQNEPSPLATTTLAARCTEKLVQDFRYLRANAVQPLGRLLDYITYGYMIDNVMLLITGTLRARDTHDLLDRCHPLGMFDTIAALCVATNVAELYNTVLVETPLAPYFSGCLSAHDLDEMNIEIIRNTLYKAYLEDFYQFCQTLGGIHAETMKEVLEFEADRRAITITINSFGTDLSKDERTKLYPNFGRLYPDGTARLARVDDAEQVRAVVDQYPEYRGYFEHSSVGDHDKTLDDHFFEHEVKTNVNAFYQQFNFAVFFAYMRLKEQEIRNLVWIAECISQQQRDKINNYIPIF